MTDARTETHRRIAERLAGHRIFGVKCECGWPAYTDQSYPQHLADAVLELFPTAAWVSAGERQLLMLRSWPPEPVVPEEPQDA